MTVGCIPHNRTEAEAWEMSRQWWRTVSQFPEEQSVTKYLVAPTAHPDDVLPDNSDKPAPPKSVMPITEGVADMLSISWPPAQDWLQNLPMQGDVQTFDGVDHRSLIDNNVWSPTTHPSGWELVDAPTGPQPWAQPTGAQDAYATGDRVTHPNAEDDGNVWLFRSKIDANTTEPGTDGAFHRWWEPVKVTP